MYKQNWIEKISLKEIQDIDNNFWKYLSKEAYVVSKGNLRIPISMELFFIEKFEYDSLKKDLVNVINSAKKIATKYLEDIDLQKFIGLNELERDLVINSFEDDFVGVVRVDMFFGHTPKLIEINSDFPDGLFMHDKTLKGMLNLINENFVEAKSNTEMFGKLLVDQNVSKLAHIFVGFNKGRTFIDEFNLTKKELIKLGWHNVSVGAIEDLVFKEGNFYYENKKVDFVRRGVELSKIRDNNTLIQNLQLAQNNSELKVINNFKMRLLGHKSIMAAFYEAKFRKYLTKEELDSVELLVPKTYKLASCIKKDLVRNQNDWVLKIVDGTEGNNVFVGQSLSNIEWSKALDKAYEHSNQWIVQEKVEVPEDEFNLLINNEVIKVKKKYDFCPHIILFSDKSEMGNILVRFSEDSLLNVMKGGGITYCHCKE